MRIASIMQIKQSMTSYQFKIWLTKSHISEHTTHTRTHFYCLRPRVSNRWLEETPPRTMGAPHTKGGSIGGRIPPGDGGAAPPQRAPVLRRAFRRSLPSYVTSPLICHLMAKISAMSERWFVYFPAFDNQPFFRFFIYCDISGRRIDFTV